MMKRLIFLMLFLGLMISACSGDSGNGAATATEQYIRALSAKDKALITNLSCKEWEESAILEVDALLSVESEVKDLSCAVTGEDGDNTLVVCSGSLDLTYNDEIRAIDLSRRTYYLQQTNGQWQVCEYK
jgi:hypothetical protein